MSPLLFHSLPIVSILPDLPLLPRLPPQDDLGELIDRELESLSARAMTSMDPALDVFMALSHDTGGDTSPEDETTIHDTNETDDTTLRYCSLTAAHANPLAIRRSVIPAAKPRRRRDYLICSSPDYRVMSPQCLFNSISILDQAPHT